MARKKRSTRRRSTGILGNLNRPLMGAAGVVAYESFISPMIPLQGVAKDMLELAAGLWLSKRQGFVGATGKTLVTINSYQILSGLVGGQLKNIMNNTPTSEYAYE